MHERRKFLIQSAAMIAATGLGWRPPRAEGGGAVARVSSDRFNGAIIDFSELDITTAPSQNNGTNVPEPATLALLATGLSGIVVRRLVRKASGA